jgi:Fe-S oxidoreductase
LITEGRLKLSRAKDVGNIVFHDSCYLGRYNTIYGPPRQAITASAGRAPIEMERRQNNSFCCGAGGGRMWMEESIGKRINVARVEQALEKNPDTICVCCPYCVIMFEDGLKDKGADDSVQVLDLAEIVSRALPNNA